MHGCMYIHMSGCMHDHKGLLNDEVPVKKRPSGKARGSNKHWLSMASITSLLYHSRLRMRLKLGS